MLGAMAAVVPAIYEWVGVGILRRGWVDLDLPWTASLALIGLWLLI